MKNPNAGQHPHCVPTQPAPEATGAGRREADDALYQIGIVASILKDMAAADHAGTRPICPASVEWLADRQQECLDRLEAVMVRSWRLGE